MNTWPDTDGKIIARYLDQLRLRYPTSPTYYRQALYSFHDVAVRQRSQSSQSMREALQTWMNERALVWARSTLLHRARIINHFLDFLVQDGLIASNPVADLCAEYMRKAIKRSCGLFSRLIPTRHSKRYGSSRRSTASSAR
jgi:site-specific recombinase XerC